MVREAIPKKNSRPQVRPIQVFLIASSATYQKAAALAASTYAVKGNPSVTVLIPQRERTSSALKLLAKRHGFQISRFPFLAGRPDNFVALLKCQAFAWVCTRLPDNAIAAFVDADTCCIRRLALSNEMRARILQGQIGMVPDICDRHSNDTKSPWFLTVQERLTYVNSGVIFLSCQSEPFFSRVLEISRKTRSFIGPMQDQVLINFALGRFFSNRLTLLKTKFNSIEVETKSTTIVHFAGGAGLLGHQDRNRHHANRCRLILGEAQRVIE